MLGPLVNAGVIVICALVGCFVLRGIPKRFEEIIKKGLGLAIVYVGLRGAMENRHVLLLILSLVGGAAAGELIDIDTWMNRLGRWAERKLAMKERPPGAGASGSGGKSFSKGFVAGSILFCTGSMAIVGSLQSGLQGNHETLYAKSILDGTMSIVFGASFGIGVLFAAVPVLLYQGGIVLFSQVLRDLLNQEIITEMSAVGNLLVAAIGFNFLGVQEIKVANLIPAIFIPWVYLGIKG